MLVVVVCHCLPIKVRWSEAEQLSNYVIVYPQKHIIITRPNLLIPMLFLSLRPTRVLSRICTKCSYLSTSPRIGNSEGAGTSSSNPSSARSQGAESRLRAEIVGPEVKPGELLPLSRPLGVTERPTTVLKTRTDKIKELMDKDVRMAQRRHLFVSLYPSSCSCS